MQKKIIITSIFLLAVCIGVFLYLHNQETYKEEHNRLLYANVIFKGSKYEFPIVVEKGNTLEETLFKLNKVDATRYQFFSIGKEMVDKNFKIFKDCIFKVT